MRKAINIITAFILSTVLHLNPVLSQHKKDSLKILIPNMTAEGVFVPDSIFIIKIEREVFNLERNVVMKSATFKLSDTVYNKSQSLLMEILNTHYSLINPNRFIQYRILLLDKRFVIINVNNPLILIDSFLLNEGNITSDETFNHLWWE